MTRTTIVVVVAALVFLSFCHCTSARQRMGQQRGNLAELIPAQSCYYQAYNNCLTCNCNGTETSATLDFELGYYVFGSGNDIREVRLQNCRQLFVRLDLRGVDATNVPIHFRAIQHVEFESISFEPTYSDRQELELNFYNVDKLIFDGINVRDTLKIRATNVKQALIVNSTFAHIPIRGITVSRAFNVEIRDSRFARISRRSIVVEKTKEVMVVNNEMTVNAFEVVFAKDGSVLMISCNRLLDQPVPPECNIVTTTTATTTTTITKPVKRLYPRPSFSDSTILSSESNNNEELKDHLWEIIGGVVGGILVIVILILLVLILLRRRRKGDKFEQNGAQPDDLPLEDTHDGDGDERNVVESDSLMEDEDADETKAKFASPIWLDEIQKNKIFNRQKSMLSEGEVEALPEVADEEMNHSPNSSIPANSKLLAVNQEVARQAGVLHEREKTLETADDGMPAEGRRNPELLT